MSKDQTTLRPWAWCNNNSCLYGNKREKTQDCILHCDSINSPSEANAKLIVKAVNNLDLSVKAFTDILSSNNIEEIKVYANKMVQLLQNNTSD